MNNSPSKPSETPGTEKPRTPSDPGWHSNTYIRGNNTRDPNSSVYTNIGGSVHHTNTRKGRLGLYGGLMVPQGLANAIASGVNKATDGVKSGVNKARGAVTQAADTFAELRARAGGAAAAAKEAWNWTDG